MSFTDEDLKRFLEAEHCDECGMPNRTKSDIEGIVDRLKAAERMYLIIESKMSLPEAQQKHIIEAWLKSKGEPSVKS